MRPPQTGSLSYRNKIIIRHVVLTTALFLAVSSRVGWSQNVPTVSKGNIELGLFGGESYGLDRFRPMAGGNLAFGLSRLIYPFVEGSYLPGVARTAETANKTATYQYKTDLTDFHGGIHFRLVPGETRIIPYLVGGTGVIHASAYNALITLPSSVPGQPPFTFSPQVPSKTSWEVNFGGGLRFFFTERFGIRLEMKAFKPTTAPVGTSTSLVYRFAIGPYFQLK